MTAPKSNHETESTLQARIDDVSDVLLVTPEEGENGDVPEQYQTREDLEKALNEAKKSEAHLRKIIDTIPTLAWCNLPDGSNEFVNRRWCDYTGLSPEEVQRVGCKVAIHPEDLPKWLDEWRTLVASGEGGEIEARLRRHDGVYRRFLIRVEPLQDESGEIVRWYGTNTDIDDLRQTEEKLRQEERELRRITDAIPQTIVVQGPDGSPIYANQAVLDYTGLTLQDVITSDFRARYSDHPGAAGSSAVLVQIEEVGHVLVAVVWSQYSVPESAESAPSVDRTPSIRKDLVYLAEWMCKFNVLVVVLRQLSV